jgi:outer membrane protein assembly factor BamB
MKIIFLLTLCVSLVFAGDWPQFKQTPDRYGCNLEETIALPSKLCLWVDFGFPVFASPAIADNRAYAIASNGLIACVDLLANRIVWSRKLGGVNNEGTPSVKGGKVYVGTKDGKFQVLDAITGSLLNTYDAGGPIFASPLILDDGIYFGSFDSTFHALDLDGNLKWKYTANVNIIHAACYYDSTIVFVDGDDKLFWAAETGVVRVAQLPVGDPQAILSAPVVWRDTVYMARDFTELGYAGIWLYSFLTGAELKRKVGTGSQVRTAISVDTGTGYVYAGGNNDGLFAMLGITGKWRTPPQTETHPPSGTYRVNSSPAVVSNCVIAGTEDDGLCFYSKGTGSEIWSYAPAGIKPINSAPAVSNGRVVVGSTDGCLYGFWDGTEVHTPLMILGTQTERKAPAAAGEWSLRLFPNPAKGQVRFNIHNLPARSDISVYSLNGRLAAKIVCLHAGTDEIAWDGRGLSGKPLASGNYLVRVNNGNGALLRTFKLQIVY